MVFPYLFWWLVFCLTMSPCEQVPGGELHTNLGPWSGHILTFPLHIVHTMLGWAGNVESLAVLRLAH